MEAFAQIMREPPSARASMLGVLMGDFMDIHYSFIFSSLF